jgi:hypothetical protein
MIFIEGSCLFAEKGRRTECGIVSEIKPILRFRGGFAVVPPISLRNAGDNATDLA